MMTPQRQSLLCVLLAAAVVASAMWVAVARHEARQLFVELEALNREHDRLQIDWGRLQIEQSAWAAHPRVESLATEQLSLLPPDQTQMIMLEEATP